jgi:hypothetical protein
MKKNEKMSSIILRNNNFFNYYFNTTKNSNIKQKKFNKVKYDISTASNIIKEYKKLSKSKLVKSELALNKINPLYKRNTTINKGKESITEEILPFNNRIWLKKKFKSNLFDDHNKTKNITSNNINNNFYNDDTSHSSMETIKKILYSTDSKNDIKKDNINNILKNSKLNDNVPNLKDMFNIKKKTALTKMKEKENEFNKEANDKNPHIKNMDKIDKELLNRINDELALNAKRVGLKSMKFIKNNNNNYDYDFDFDNEDSLSVSNEFKDIIQEKNNDNNKNYTFRKINNNINININNNTNTNTNNNKIIKKKIKNVKSEINEIDKNFYKSKNLNENIDFYINNIKEDIHKNDEVFYLKEKIKELNEEIKNKNILINEYSNLVLKTKQKLEQVVINNKKRIDQIQKVDNNKIMLYKSKLISVEKEKQIILNKYLENKKYSDFLEKILSNQNNEEIDNNSYENNKNKEIIKKLMNAITKLKIELENKNKDNEKLKNIIIKYKENKSYRAISNPRKNIRSFEKEENNGATNMHSNNKKVLSNNLSEIRKNYFK